MTDTEKEAAIARLADAMHKGHVKYMGGDTIPSNWEYFRALARIAIEDAVVPVWMKFPALLMGSKWVRPEIPWSAVCAEESK